MIDTDRLLEIAQAACDAAMAAGAEFVDVSAGSARSLSVDLESSAIECCEENADAGVSVRAIYRGGTGWASADTVDVDQAAQTGTTAAELSLLSQPDPDFVSLPGPASQYPEVPDLWDDRVAGLEIGSLIKYAISNIDSALAVDSRMVVSGGFHVSASKRAIVNSLGVRLGSAATRIGGSIMAVVRSGDDVGSFYEYDSARTAEDFEPDGIGTEAARQALKYMGARKIAGGRMPVVLGPLASPSVFYGLAGNTDAENVMRGRSFLAGKVGERVASELVTLTDNPLIPGGLGSRAFDSEGFPCEPLVIVEKGILKTYIYGSYTSNKAKVPNTGHGTRGNSASLSNLICELGGVTSQEIIKSTKRGLYLNMGSIRPDAITGDVSGAVDFGFMIEDGQLAYPVQSAMIGGSFLDMTRNIDAISSDCRREPGALMPTIRIEDVLVSGSK